MKNPIVSVVVITYNSSQFVLETLKSIYNQTYKNIELIISDDCSTDNTVEICKQWLDRFKDRFVHAELNINQRNLGISANCNRGLSTTNGEWIKFIAGDDILIKNCIELNIQFANKSSAHFIHSKVTIIDENGNNLKKIQDKKDKFFKKQITLKDYIKNSALITTPSVFFNKKIIINAGGFDEDIPFLEDCPIFFKILKTGEICQGFENRTIGYRTNINSISNTTSYYNIIFIKSLSIYYYKLLIPELWRNYMIIDIIRKYKFIKYRELYLLFGNTKNLKTNLLKLTFYPLKTSLNVLNKLSSK